MTEDPGAKYDQWASDIEKMLKSYAHLRRQVRYFPLYGIITAPLGFIWSPLVGVAIFFAWIVFWGATMYITSMKTWQYKGELAQTRRVAAQVRAGR